MTDRRKSASEPHDWPGTYHADDERILGHLERVLGGEGCVFHELISDKIHVDVHVMLPTEKRPFHVLVTSGMSALPMTVSDLVEDPASFRHAELCMLLPSDWKLDEGSLHDERWYWPIRLLKQLARLPHEQGTYLAYGHSIASGDPPTPYADGTELSGAVIVGTFALPDLFNVPGDPPLRIWQVLPVTDREMAFKMEHGSDALLQRLEEGTERVELYGPIDPARKSII